MSVEAVNKCLDGWLVEVPDVGGRLSWLFASDERLWVDEAESVDNDLALDGLDWIDDDCYCAWVELLEGLLCVDVDGGQPTTEAWMGMIPADNCLGTSFLSAQLNNMIGGCLPSSLPQHIHHLCLEHRIDGLDTDTSTTLWHCKHINHSNCEIVDELSQHQSHDFHGNPRATVS